MSRALVPTRRSVHILPLTRPDLPAAQRVGARGFPYLAREPAADFSASLSRRARRERYGADGIFGLQSWVAKDQTGSVIGTVGLYSEPSDCHEAAWVGWFTVDPGAGGLGTGQKLLQFAIDEATRRGKRYLRLYTSDHPNEARAGQMYRRAGFREFAPRTSSEVRRPDGTPYRLIWLEKDLEKPSAEPDAFDRPVVGD
jgi:GNAT superfamily N-acetyltransferase